MRNLFYSLIEHELNHKIISQTCFSCTQISHIFLKVVNCIANPVSFLSSTKKTKITFSMFQPYIQTSSLKKINFRHFFSLQAMMAHLLFHDTVLNRNPPSWAIVSSTHWVVTIDHKFKKK